MIVLSAIEVSGREAAIRAMRNPFKSWAKSDTDYDAPEAYIGRNDLKLAMKLIHSGSSHCKFRRMISATFDMTAPEYFWKEFDTYKVGTVACSTSTMHTLLSCELSLDDFSTEYVKGNDEAFALDETIKVINGLIRKSDLKAAVQLLPMSYLYTRTIATNYETLANMYKQRRNHKLKEWRDFCDKLANDFPWPMFITGRVC